MHLPSMWKIVAFYIVGWYFWAIALSLYNKWMFDPHNGLGVQCPIFVTSFHQITLWALSFIYIKVKHVGSGKTKEQIALTKPGEADWKFYLKYLIPTALATAGDIGLSNVSFKFVPLTVYTIIKSSSIAFVLLFSCIFKIEKFHWKLGTIVAVMFSGVVLMVYKPSGGAYSEDSEVSETDRSLFLFGCLVVLGSSCLSGLRWVYTQLILKKVPKNNLVATADVENHIDEDDTVSINVSSEPKEQEEKPHPIYTIYQLAPIMGVALLATSLIVERPFQQLFKSNLFKPSFDDEQIVTFGSICKGIFLIILPGIDVFFLTLCEFGILQYTKVLTLSIAGVVKEVLTILFGVLVLSERISGIYNWIGMTIVLLDVSYYNYFRYTQKQQQSYIKISNDESLNQIPLQDVENELTYNDANDGFVEPYSASTDTMYQEYELDVIAKKEARASLTGSDQITNEPSIQSAEFFKDETKPEP